MGWVMVRYCSLLVISVFHFSSLAVLPVVDTGSLQRGGKYSFFTYGHLAYQKDSFRKKAMLGGDVVARLDQGLLFYRDINVRYFIAMGRSGVQGGSFLKWVPFPDYRYQPAVGMSAGFGYRAANFWDKDKVMSLASHFIELYFHPLVSKEWGTVKGLIVPYVALPLVLQASLDGEVMRVLWQLVLGMRGELFFIHFHKFELNMELSVGFAKARSNYFSVGVITQL